MRSTRRPLDSRGRDRIFVISLLGMGMFAASCSSSDDPELGPDDGGVEASSRVDAGAVPADAEVPPARDAGALDAGPLPVTCASQPCARALVTTRPGDEDDQGEGFCVLLDDGAVACWGANGAGQLGRGEDGGRIDSSNAAKVVGLSGIVALEHTCGIDGAGSAWCWGTGPFRWSEAGTAVSTEATPVKLALPPVVRISVDAKTACASTQDGTLCWGDNANGQVGVVTESYVGPQRVGLPAGAPPRAVAVGQATFLLREDGSLLTWGSNPGIGRVSPSFPDPTPQPVALDGVSSIDVVRDNACVTALGTGYCWGARVNAREGTALDRALPARVIAPAPIVQIATTHTVVARSGTIQPYRWCAVSTSGDVYCWGSNENGQAGDGTNDYALRAVKVAGLPAPATQVKTTSNSTCALLTTGKVFCWGSNYYGQLGNGRNRGRGAVPAEVVLP